jgi:hypothetical protein
MFRVWWSVRFRGAPTDRRISRMTTNAIRVEEGKGKGESWGRLAGRFAALGGRLDAAASAAAASGAAEKHNIRYIRGIAVRASSFFARGAAAQ